MVMCVAIANSRIYWLVQKLQKSKGQLHTWHIIIYAVITGVFIKMGALTLYRLPRNLQRTCSNCSQAKHQSSHPFLCLQ